MYLLALSSLLLLLACQGPEGPMGPAANPKVTAAQQEDGCVVINISGENMTVNGVEDPNIGAADTVYVTEDGEPLPTGSFSWVGVQIDGYGDASMAWIASRKGWAFYHESITQEAIHEIFLRKQVGYDPPTQTQWTTFDEYVLEFDEDERPSLTITDSINEIFIKDPEEVLERTFDPDTYVPTAYFIGIQMNSE